MDEIFEIDRKRTMNFERALVLHSLSLFLYLFDLWNESEKLFQYNGFGGKFKYLTFLSKVSLDRKFGSSINLQEQ